ncbi:MULTISPECIES: glycosyltransferase family 2 protein [unclassified Rhodanobacter]|uniref:Glycosyltransferase n=1 Tax=Rhodanobacter humi TaxID=1888173 RepID=A0ABV4AV97_9GAMM
MAAHLYHDQIGISHSELSQREYRRWLESHDRASVLSSSGGSVQQQTLISVLLPVYNTPPDVLIACLESVLAQTCGRWELCISDDASTRRDTADVLVRYAGRDPRIRIEKRASNGHISAATNTALAMAGGEFVALLDHDDLLHPDAILEVVTAACANPEWHLIYTDEDKLDRRGRRSDPYFKPDYNPELLTAQNYISHLGVYRTAIVRELGGFQIGYEGCQDWDLALRFCERVGASAIGHIPKVLYHWRMSATSTAEDTSVKPYVQQVAMKVLTDHVRRVRPGASVRRLNWPYGAFRVQEGPPADEHVSVIVWEQAGQPIDCLGNMFETLGSTMSVEVIIPVNNGNIAKRWFGDHVPGALSLKVLGTTNTNPAESRNEAARMAKGSILVFVNKDIDAFSKGWLDELVAQARRPDIGVVGAKIYDPRGWVTDGAFVLGGAGGINVAFGGLDSAAVGPRARALHVQDVSAVSGACMAMRANVFHSIGGFSHASVESLVAADLCLRIRANGYRTIWTPYVELYMHEISGASPVQGQNVHGERAWLFQHYPKELLADPFYSTNLEATPAHFKLAT